MTQSESEQTKAATDVLAERERQKTAKGYDAEHDGELPDGDLAKAGAAYALHGALSDGARTDKRDKNRWPFCWPWGAECWRPKSQREDLVRAGALILAEIERLDQSKP